MSRASVIAPATVLLTLTMMSVALRDAHAQEASTTGAAAALFDEGVALMEKGKWSEACPKLARSNALSPNGGTLFALAECYESNGQIASAWVTYKEASIRATAAHRDDAAQKATNSAAKLEPRVSRLTIVVPAASDVAGLSVMLDSRPVERAEWSVATPIDPGTHVITATAPNRTAFKKTTAVTNAPNAKALLYTLQIPVLAAAPLSSSSPASNDANDGKRGRNQRILGLVIGGVGVAGLAVGTVFGLSATSKNDDAASHCHDTTLCDGEGLRLDKQGRDAATISTISFIAGGVLVAGGLVLFLTAPHSRPPSSSSSAANVVLHGFRF